LCFIKFYKVKKNMFEMHAKYLNQPKLQISPIELNPILPSILTCGDLNETLF